MSGVAIARSLLTANSGLTAVVPATRIVAGVLPLQTALPAIAITQISSMQRNPVAMNGSRYLVTERVQVMVHAISYPQQKSILGIVRAALPNTHATVNGFDCDSILPDLEGPDMYDQEVGSYEQSQDFFIRFNR